MPTSEAAISEAVRCRIGRERIRRFEVTARDIRRFAQAIGETNLIHFDEQYARQTRYGGIVAPALFYQAMAFDDVSADQLPADGSPIELDVPVPAPRAVGGSSDFTIHRLVRPGDVVTVTSRLKDICAKEGKSGPLFLVMVETEYRDAAGDLMAVEQATYVKRP